MQTAVVHAFGRQPAPPHWPIDRHCLAALKDLGLTDKRIARYFRVRQEEVAVLRTSYGIADTPELTREAPPKRGLFAWRRKA